MVSKAVIFCAVAFLIQTTFGQCLRNIEVTTSECGCSSSRTRSSDGSGSVRAISIGTFKGGKFASDSSCSNTESSSTSSSNSESSSCSISNAGLRVSNAGLSSSNAGLSCSNAGLSASNAFSSGSSGLSVSNGLSSSNSGLSLSNAGYIVTNADSVSGGPFIVNCYGPLAPSGISVSAYSDLIGDLVVSGQLPFLSAVGFEGAFQNAGTASVAYGCGDGNIAIQEIIGAKPGSCGYIL